MGDGMMGLDRLTFENEDFATTKVATCGSSPAFCMGGRMAMADLTKSWANERAYHMEGGWAGSTHPTRRRGR